MLPTHLPDFSQYTILVIGDVMLDRYWLGDTNRISPEAPVPIVNIRDTHYRPGGAGNVALNIASLGAKVILLGLVGKDEAAELLNTQLSAANVSADLCFIDNITTIIKLRIMSRHQQLVRLDFEENLAHHDYTDLLYLRYQQYLAKVDLVILSDYQKGCLINPQPFIQLAKNHQLPILVDPKGSDFNRYNEATIITPNLKEFEAVVGPCRHEQELIEKGKSLLKNYQIKQLLVTRGEEGMSLIDDQTHLHLPAYAQEVFDVTGAGDTVIATLGTALAARMELVEATALANLAASLAIAKLGAANISSYELQKAMAKQISFSAGIVSEEELLLAIRHLRAQGKKFVFTNGCFDILHAGHVSYLQKAKQLGDYLIVAINSDQSIKELKGLHRPINSLNDRMTVIAGLSAVDWVIPFEDLTPHRLLNLLQPDYLVKGSDYERHQIVGAEVVEAYGGNVMIMNHPIKTSSTHLIQRMQESYDETN